MVELERSDAPVVAAHNAASARLLDEDLLQAFSAAHHAIGPAALAAVITPPFEDEIGRPVSSALHGDRQFAGRSCGLRDVARPATGRIYRAKPILPHPVLHG